MRCQPVESSAVSCIGYDPNSQILEIEFSEGRRYRYHGVTPSDYQALMAAESIGTYVNQVIKLKYPVYEEM
jgi:hypothetical protein